jgi:hypothetical protein
MTPEEKADVARLIAGIVSDTEKTAAKAAWNEALEAAAEELDARFGPDVAEIIRALKHPEDRP